MTKRIQRLIPILLLGLRCGGVIAAPAPDIVLENDACRLVLSPDGYATSLVVKETGAECLTSGVRIPFARLEQNYPYDNEEKLKYPAKPWKLKSNRLVRRGDVLEVGFEREFHVVSLRLVVTNGYMAFIPLKSDYRPTDYVGLKRVTEIDGLEFLRLPLANRTHFGPCANVTWDDRAAVAVMGCSPDVAVDAVEPEGTTGWKAFSAHVENQTGIWQRGAVLVATTKARFLDRVDAFERDFDLPRGAQNRRNPLLRYSYYFMTDASPSNIAEHVMWMKKGGFRIGMISYVSFAKTCGHFLWKKTYPNGLADLKAVTDTMRAAGIIPAIHIHYNKVTKDDPYMTAGDPRIGCVKEVCLARDASPTDTTFALQGDTAGLRTEPGRRYIRFDREIVSYEAFSTEPPWVLTGVKRGAFGSAPAAHTRNTYGRHLNTDDWVRFHRVDQDTTIADEIAARLAKIINTCGFRVIYFDGAEDVPPPQWRNVARAQYRVWQKLDPKPLGAEGALKSTFGWHMLSRGNAFDCFHPEKYASAYEKHLKPAAEMAAADFSVVNFGWMRFFLPNEKLGGVSAEILDDPTLAVTAGTTPACMDFIARKAAEHGVPLSLQGSLSKFREHPQTEAILATLKRWEDLKEPQSIKEQK